MTTKNKKAFSTLFVLILCCLFTVMFGCTDDYKNMKLEIKGDTEIVLYLEPEGEEQKQVQEITVSITGVKEDVNKSVTVQVENQDCISVEIGKPNDEGISKITITAKQGGSTVLHIMSVEGNKTATINVSVVQALTDIKLQTGYYKQVFSGKSLVLEPDQILDFIPTTTSQKNIKFALADTYNGIEIVESNGVSTLNVGANVGTQIIKVNATAMNGDEVIETIDTVTFEIRVIEELTNENVIINNNSNNSEPLTYLNGKYETINLKSNSAITSVSRYNELELVFSPKNNTNAKIIVNDYYLMDTGIAEVSVNGDPTTTYLYKVMGAGPGETALCFKIGLEGANGEQYSNYEYEVKIPVKVQELPSVVTVNENNDDFNGTLFTSYNGKGMKFTIVVGSSSAYDFTYEIRFDPNAVTLFDSTGSTISALDIGNGENTLKKSNPRSAQTPSVIYAVAKKDAIGRTDTINTISFVACATLTEELVQTNFNFVISQGVESISLTDEFENNVMYVEKGGQAYLNYSLDPAESESVVYDYSYITTSILTNDGANYISLVRDTEVNGRFIVNGLENNMNGISVSVVALNGVQSKPIIIKVYTPGTSVAVSLPSTSNSINILATNYEETKIGGYTVADLVQPFKNITIQENGEAIAVLENEESIDTPSFASVIATNTGVTFQLTNDPTNKNQTIVSKSYTIVVPEQNGNTITFRKANAEDKIKGTVTVGGYLQTTTDGTMYILLKIDFLTGGTENGKVETKSYHRLLAINSYPKITSVTLKSLSEETIYNKDGVGDIDVLTSNIKVYNYTQLTIAPEVALSKEILRSDTTSSKWELTGLPKGINITERYASEFKEFGGDSEESINDLKGVVLIYDDTTTAGVYEYADSEDKIYTKAYVLFNFDDAFFGIYNSKIVNLSTQITQFTTTYNNTITLTVRRPVRATSIDLNTTATNVSNSNKVELEKLTNYMYELYIDSRSGLNTLESIANVTTKNTNLINSWEIKTTMYPSNITNGKLQYVICDSEGEEITSNAIIKILDDGTIIPISSGVAYVKLVPMSGELVNTYTIKVRVADGMSWKTAYKVYTQSDLLAIQGDENTCYETMSKYYELANDIYLNTTTFTPLGVFTSDDIVSAFRGGLTGSNEYTDKIYTIYNLNITPASVNNDIYGGLFGKVSGTIRELGITVQTCNITEESDSKTLYVGAVAGKSTLEANIEGVVVNYISTQIDTNSVAYLGGVVGYNEGKILDYSKTAIYDTGYTKDVITKTRVTGAITVDATTTSYVGGLVGFNGAKAEIKSNFNYFGETINYNNANDNVDCSIVVETSALINALGNVGGIAGYNTGKISNISSVALINATVENAGGITGINCGELQHTYFVGKIKNARNVGGISGKLDVYVDENGNAITSTMNLCIAEILDTTISTTTINTESRIQGTENVGGLVGYADFTVNEAATYTKVHTITNSYVRSYFTNTTISDIALVNGANGGNLGGLIGYAKNTKIASSYATVTLIIDEVKTNINVGGLVGKLENFVFTARDSAGSKEFLDNISITDCYTTGTLKATTISAEIEDLSTVTVAQLVGLVTEKSTSSNKSTDYIINRVYTNMNTIILDNTEKLFNLVGKTEINPLYVSSAYYLYTNENLVSDSSIGTSSTLNELKAGTMFASWSTATWGRLLGANDGLIIIYVLIDGDYRPLYTITPSEIALSIKEYTKEDEDQLFTRVDSQSDKTTTADKDSLSKAVVLYIYENKTNEYSIDNVIKITASYTGNSSAILNNARYLVVSSNETIVKITGDKLYPLGEGTCIITICSAYNKEVYDCIQIAVVYHKFDMVFLDKDYEEYEEDDTLTIAKNNGKQVIVYIDSDSSIAGITVEGMVESGAIKINGDYIGSDLPLQTSTTSAYNNTLTIVEQGIYEETTYITLTTIPYYTISYCSDAKFIHDNKIEDLTEYVSTKKIYNKQDIKVLNVLIYVGASEIVFNTNDVVSNIGSEISVTVTIKTDYEEDNLLVFDENNVLLSSDDTKDLKVEKDDYTITYLASSKNVVKYHDALNREQFAGNITYEFKINASDKYLNTNSGDMTILYRTIASNLKFAARSSYISDILSNEIAKYSVTNTFNFKITPAVVSSMSIQNYSAGRTTSGKYNPKEDPSTLIIPGEVGLLDIMINPIYAGITRITLENDPQNITNISLLQVLQEESTGMYVQSNGIENIQNGIALSCTSKILGDGSISYDGHFYVRTLLASDAPLDKNLTLVVTVYYEENGVTQAKQQSITLLTSQTYSLSMSFDGNKYAYVVKGSSVTPMSKTVGFTTDIVYSLPPIEPTYENFLTYFDKSFTALFASKDDITTEDIDILFRDQIRVNSDTGEVYVGILIKQGTVLTLQATVTENMSTGGKSASDTANIYVIDYKITGITVQNTINNTLTAVCNIAKSLKVDLVIEECKESDYTSYIELEEVLTDKTFSNLKMAVVNYFAGNNTRKVDIENLKREINTYEGNVWLYSSDNDKTASVRTYNSVVIGGSYDGLFDIESMVYDNNGNLTCYAIKMKEKTTVVFMANVALTFQFNATTQEVVYTFNPTKDNSISGVTTEYTYNFNVYGMDSSSLDNPLPIYDADKFEEYIFNTEDIHYILLTDIVLNNWTAKDTSIASLDGNGHTITITSFAEQTEEEAYFGLFKTISRDTVLKNVHVVLDRNLELKTSSANTEKVYVGLFAYENLGTLYNCSVTTNGEVTVDVNCVNATTITNSLFVNINGASGTISNSRVGDNEYATNVLHFKSYNDIAGFVTTNSGHIASCYAKNISLDCKELGALAIDSTGVAGFAKTNTSTGKIYFSYVEGIRGDDYLNSQIQLSALGYKTYNTGIYSPGRIAGFVYINTGYIQDTYANIPLISPTSSTGYVYQNNSGAKIINAMSLCLQPTTLDNGQAEYPNTSRSQFTGLDDLNEVLNKGSITYAYYYNTDYDSNIFTGLGEPAVALPADSFIDSLDEFGNFVGGDDMIWEASNLHPQLVSANRILKGQKYLANPPSETATEEELENYVYYYEDVINSEYSISGSYTNPIVIATPSQFVQMGDDEYLTIYTQTSTNKTYLTKLNQKDYILIRDIDVSLVVDTGLDKLQKITYAGMFEGNGYTLQNVSILSDESYSGASFGMFEQIGAFVLFENDILVTVDTVNYHSQIKNLNIEINKIGGTHAVAVGSLAGIIVNSDIVNINLISSSSDGEKVSVQGERYVGGLAGYVAGDSTIINISSDVSVSSEYRNKNNGTESAFDNLLPFIKGNVEIPSSIDSYKFNIDTVNYTGGYAGGIAGLVDCFKMKLTKNANTMFAAITRYDYDKTGYNYVPANFAPQVSGVTVSGDVTIIGNVAGGVIGLNYQGTSIYNARFILEMGDSQKISGEIITGGLIGQNYGKIDQSALTHEDSLQLSLDDGSYEGEEEVSTKLFYEESKEPLYVGGLVGYNEGTGNSSGIVTNSYSRANVINPNANYIGGMVGYMTNGYLQYCYVSGNVVGNRYAAGAVGYLASFITKTSIKYFTEYTGLAYYSMWGLVCANNWTNDVDITTTGALLGYVSGSVRLTENVINGQLDLFVNNLKERLNDVVYSQITDSSYNITNGTIQGVTGYRLIESYTYQEFTNYANEGANPDEHILYQTWDRNIWDLSTPYFPLLLLNSEGDQNYITNEDELRSIGTSGFYTLLNDIYLTKDWIPVEGFEGTLTSKKKPDGTYCTIYNININGDCYISEETGEVENIGNVGFFSSVKDKAYIYNINFMFGGNITVDDTDYVHGLTHVQRDHWENYKGEVGYVETSGVKGDISYSKAFVNGITNYLDYSKMVTNNSSDIVSGLFKNSYGTGSVAGVATNATFNNVTVSFGEYTYYNSNGTEKKTVRASINANTIYIGGFVGYVANCKFTNCQVADNPTATFVKNNAGERIEVEGIATINVYTNEYPETLNSETLKGLVTDFAGKTEAEVGKIVLSFYQQAQCVGGFAGKMDANSTYIKFNGRSVGAHIKVYEKYGKSNYSIPSLTLNIGGLIGYSNVASIDSVNVYGTITSSVNTTGVSSSITGLDSSYNKTELNIGGIAGITERGIFNYVVYQGTIKLVESKRSSTTSSKAQANSIVNVGGIIGKTKGDISITYGITTANTYTKKSGYASYNQPIIVDMNKIKLNELNIGGTLGYALASSPKIRKSLFYGNIELISGTIYDLKVGGILGSGYGDKLASNIVTIQNSYTAGDINIGTTIETNLYVAGIVGYVLKANISCVASTMNINKLGETLGNKNTAVYAGNLGGMLGYTGTTSVTITDSFTGGTIRVVKANLTGAIGGFVGAMFGKVMKSYSATTIISIADSNAVSVECSEGEAKYASQDGIIGAMFGYSSSVLDTTTTKTAFYVFDYAGCVLREVESDSARYGVQVSVADMTKECIYGTTDPIMSVFATSSTGAWKTLTYGDYFTGALYTYSMPILSFLEADTTLNSYCKFNETTTDRIDILQNPDPKDEGFTKNELAQEYEVYYGSKLYPYLLKTRDGYTFSEFRNKVTKEGIDVNNSYFALGADFILNLDSVGFDKINFYLLGYGNALTISGGYLFANELNNEKFISSVNFISDFGIIGVNNGIIYNSLVSGNQTYDSINGYASSFIITNKGTIVDSGVITNVTIKELKASAKFGLFVADNYGVINSCFTTGIIYFNNGICTTGSVAGFAHTVEKDSYMVNLIVATTMNVIDDDVLKFDTEMNAFVNTYVSSTVNISRVFVDQLAIGYDGAKDYNLNNGNKSVIDNSVYYVNTSYLVDSEDENGAKSGSDDLKVLLGSRTTQESELDLKYALSGRNYNYDYKMEYNYGYPYPALMSYFENASLINSLSTGDGSSSNPYKIQHAGKLDWVRTISSTTDTVHFDIICDLYMNVFESFDPIYGANSITYSVSETTGRYDSTKANVFNTERFLTYNNNTKTSKNFVMNGKVNNKQSIIYYLTQNISGVEAGLFKELKENQTVKNIAITYANINTELSQKAGVLAGIVKKATLDNVSVFNSVLTISSNAATRTYAGGLIGSTEGTESISKCSAEVKINMYASQSQMNVGGLIGNASNLDKLKYCYSGSNITILDSEDVEKISKTNIGGLIGYNVNDVAGGTLIQYCTTLTSVNYSGLVGYKYNLETFATEDALTSDDLKDESKITSFANIGNVVGASYYNVETETVDDVDIKNVYFDSDITLINKSYAVGNNYNVNISGVTQTAYTTCVSKATASTYATTVGAKYGSKIKPVEINSSETLEKFGKGNDFALFGMVKSTFTNTNKEIAISGKFLYGAEIMIKTNGKFISKSENSIISKVIISLQGNSVLDSDNSTNLASSGGVANYAVNTLFNICKVSSSGNATASTSNVGGIVGNGKGSVLLKCESTAIITSSKDNSYVGGIMGTMDRGGAWACVTSGGTITATGKGAYAGGVAGHILEENAFIINCTSKSVTVKATGNKGYAGGLIGKLDGLLVNGTVGTSSSPVTVNGYYAGGVVGTVRENATNIFLNGIKVNASVTGRVAGGLVSYLIGERYIIKNVTINGTVTGTTVNGSTENYEGAGGIAGYTKGVTIGVENIPNSIAASVGGVNNVGGVVGKSIMSKIQYNTTSNIVNGTNNVGGIVGNAISSTVSNNTRSGQTQATSGQNIGGIVGYAEQTTNSEENRITYIESNKTTAAVDAGDSSVNVGGIVGYIDKLDTSVADNIVTANIKGKDGVGGIVGKSMLSGNSTNGTVMTAKNNQYKSGTITAESGSAGGIVGILSASDLIGNSIGHSAAITVKGNIAGGIAGSVVKKNSSSRESVMIQNDSMSDKSHKIEGATIAGGLIGQDKVGAVIENVTVVAGTIKTTSTTNKSYVGGLIGYALNTQIDSWAKLKFTDVVAATHTGSVQGYAGGVSGYAEGVGLGMMNLDSNIGTIKGSTAGGYYGYAKEVSISGNEEKALTVGGLTVQANGANGDIGTLIGKAESGVTINYVKISSTGTTIKGYESSSNAGAKSNSLGGIIGSISGTTISNCTSGITLQGKASRVGGLVGESLPSDNTISKSKYSGGNITSSFAASYAGGIVGYGDYLSLENNIINNSNGIKVVAKVAAGGIAGYLANGQLKSQSSVTVNIESVQATDDNSYAGGAAGIINNYTINELTINKLTSVTSKGSAGGVAGQMDCDSQTTLTKITLSSELSVAAGANAGGIVGKAVGSSTKTFSEITFKLNKISASESIGGMIGEAEQCTISKCSNTASGTTIKNAKYAGGIFGKANSSQIRETTLDGKITISGASYAGGAIGYGTDMDSLSSPSKISVAISGSKYVGGFAGYLKGSGSSASLGKVSISGSVAGTENIGGIIGYAENITMSAEYEIPGTITGSSDATSYGQFVGTAKDCSSLSLKITSSSISPSATAKSAGAFVGILSGSGSKLTASVPSNFKFSTTGCNNVGAIVGVNGGIINVTPANSRLSLTLSAGNSTNAGGFVGTNESGSSLSVSGIVGVQVKGSVANSAGIAVVNNGEIKGSYELYYQLEGSNSSGVFLSGSGSWSATAVYVHKYAGMDASNSAINYAKARKDGGTSSTFKGGSSFGSSTYMVYPTENFSFSDDMSNMRALKSDCKGYEGISESNAEAKSKNAPTYMLYENIIYLQCSVVAGNSTSYYYDNFKAEIEGIEKVTNYDKGLTEFAEGQFPCATLTDEVKKEILAAWGASEIKMGVLYGYQSSSADFVNTNWNVYNLKDVALALKQCYGDKSDNKFEVKAYSSVDSLISAFNSNMPSKFQIGTGTNHVTEEQLYKWTEFWKQCHARYGTSIFANKTEMENFLTTYFQRGNNVVGGVDEAAHSNLMSYINGKVTSGAIALNTFDDSMFKSGGAKIWFVQSSFNYKTLAQYLSSGGGSAADASNPSTGGKIATITIDMKAEIDASWTTDNPVYDIKLSFDICYSSSYSAGVAPLDGAPGNYTYEGSTGEYPEFRQGGGQMWSGDIMTTKTVAQVGCLMTSITCLIVSAGIVDNQFNPGIFNNWLANNGGYTGNCLYWASMCGKTLSGTYKGHSYSYNLSKWHFGAANLSYSSSAVTNRFNNGEKVVINVNGHHWCAVVAVNPIKVMDPAYGDTIVLSNRYPSPTGYSYYTVG